MNDALDTRYKHRYSGEHPSIPWLFEHAADTINRVRIGADGRTAYWRHKGRDFNTKVAGFGENVWYLKLASAGRHKFDPRWDNGIYLGIIDDTGEVTIGTDKGAVKAKDFRRTTIHAERWNKNKFDVIKAPLGSPLLDVEATTT